LQRYSWPGNVRELENLIQRIVVLGSEDVALELDDFEEAHSSSHINGTASAEVASDFVAADDSLGLKELVRRATEATEREALNRTLKRLHWRRAAAARHLGISYKTLLEKIKYYRLDAADS
jgi:DNA-binding NtrC family response regulator